MARLSSSISTISEAGSDAFWSLTCIVGRATVVGGREEGDKVALSKAFKAVHHALVRPHYHLQVVGLRNHIALADTPFALRTTGEPKP